MRLIEAYLQFLKVLTVLQRLSDQQMCSSKCSEKHYVLYRYSLRSLPNQWLPLSMDRYYTSNGNPARPDRAVGTPVSSSRTSLFLSREPSLRGSRLYEWMKNSVGRWRETPSSGGKLQVWIRAS